MGRVHLQFDPSTGGEQVHLCGEWRHVSSTSGHFGPSLSSVYNVSLLGYMYSKKNLLNLYEYNERKNERFTQMNSGRDQPAAQRPILAGVRRGVAFPGVAISSASTSPSLTLPLGMLALQKREGNKDPEVIIAAY